MSVPKRILVVGAGGLGCPAALALAQAGVEHLTLVDPDRVEESNLHRQLLHHPADVGRLKVESARERLSRQFPRLTVEAVPARVDAAVAGQLFPRADVVIDATDGVETKFTLSDAAVRCGVPLVYAGVLRLDGLAMRLSPGGPCLRCLFESAPADGPTCAQAGVLGSLAGLLGGLQARLALAPAEPAGAATLHVVDAGAWTFRRLTVSVASGHPAHALGAAAA